MKKWLLLCSILLIGCNGSEPETSPPLPSVLEGDWIAEGTMDDGFSWFLQYSFSGEDYSFWGYPDIGDYGHFIIKEQTEEGVLVQFMVEGGESYMTEKGSEIPEEMEGIYTKEFIWSTETEGFIYQGELYRKLD